MIIVKKTAVLSPRGAHGVSGVARFECFKERSDVRINLASGRKDLYAVVAVGDEKRVVKLSGDRIYLARTDLSGDCAAIVADGEKRVICAGATACGYDFTPLEELAVSAFGDVGKTGDVEKDGLTEEIKEDIKEAETSGETDVAGKPETEEIKAVKADEGKSENKESEKETIKDEDNDKVKENEKDGGVAEEGDEDKKEQEKGKAKEGRFFDKIADKIEKLFSENEKDEELNSLIPDSRWARVKTDDGWYVVGVVGEPSEFICYGIPGDDPSDPPEEDEGCRQWIEVEKGGRGYWMMYQSAETGETLKAI